jgi:RNA-binding protein
MDDDARANPHMDGKTLTGAEKARLRGIGQRLEATVRLGKGGLTPAFAAELQRQLKARGLVKLRFAGLGRDERSALCPRIAQESGSECVGAVGQTALFYSPVPPALPADAG